MPRVLIAGCGYVGQATADLFFERGWEVEGWTSSAESAQKVCEKAYSVLAVDISDKSQVATSKSEFDAVIHCASTRGGNVDLYRRVYLNGARNLVDRFVGSTIVFTSSTSIYGQDDEAWVTEESPTEPPCETGRVLLEAEKLVLSRGGIVARLAGIYGPGRSALLAKFLTGEAIVDSQNDRFINQVHRDDITAALLLFLDRDRATAGSVGRQIYNVVDDQPILQSECYRWLAQKLNRPLPAIGRSTSKRKRGSSNKRVSNAKLRGLGWTPKYGNFAEAMEKSILPSFGQGGA
jgi:nucleoside-diphosphate-sugar epimerase